MKLISYKHPQEFKLLAMIGQSVVEADTDTYPQFLASVDLQPVFIRGESFCIATNYVIIYPNVHVVTFREKETDEQLSVNHIH